MKKIIAFILIFALLPVINITANDDVIFAYSFEDGMKGWKFSSAAGAEFTKITTSCPTDGKKAVYISDESSEIASGVQSGLIEITAGESYTASVDCYLIEGTVKLFFKYFDANNTQLSNKSVISKAGKWENLTLCYEAPANAKYCVVVLSSIGASTGKAYFDNVKVFKGKKEPVAISGPTPPQNEDLTDVEINTLRGEVDNSLAKEVFYESFESGIEGWGYHNEMVKDCVMVTSDKAYEGKQSVFITDTSDASAPGIKSPFIEITAGKTYTAVAYFWGINNNSVRIYVKYFDKDEKNLFSKSYAPKGNGTWESLTAESLAPDTAKYCQIFIAGVGATIGEAYVDALTLYDGLYKAEKAEREYLPPKQTAPIDAKLVAPVNNKLVYNEYNEKGDKLSDYSYAGFFGGDYELPESDKLPVCETLSPSGKDDTAKIQAAIDKYERNDGGINLIKLKAGTYNISAIGIKIKSGVLLSGEGQGPTGTILYAYAPVQCMPVKFAGAEPKEVGQKAYIQDEYLKAGSKVVTLSAGDINNFKVGDSIAIVHNSTAAWSKAIGMSGVINVYGNDTTWAPDKVNMITERKITAINGNEITLDFAIFVPHMKELVPSYVTKIDDSGRVRNAGIENLRIVSYYNGSATDEEHATTAISITNAENIFVRDITSKYFYFSLISSGKRAKKVTARNCSSLEPVSVITGARRYSFASSTSAQQILYTGCYSYDGRHDFEASYSVTGPISYVDNLVDSSNTGSETHGTWSTGVLFDNIYHIGNDTNGYMASANRGINGTQLSQGWTAATSVMWNCLSSSIVVHKPPLTYQNFSIGIWGLYNDDAAKAKKEKNITSNKRAYRTGESIEHTEENFATDDNTPFIGDGYKEAHYTPVNPRSLYKAQLSERYTGVINNAKANAPIIVYPKPDKKTEKNEVEISGIYQLGATKVIIYIDNKPYEATLNKETNEFSLNITLDDGVHKIYATQVADGFEGNKTADRFITINKENGNPEYLQSIYTKDKTTMLIKDPRLSYDQVLNGIKVNINDKLLLSDVLPVNENGRVLVPMRAIFEAIDASVLWDGGAETATAKKGSREVKITKNSTTAYIDGAPYTLDVPAKIINGRFVVPVRFISEAFDCKVEWIGESQTVRIIK